MVLLVLLVSFNLLCAGAMSVYDNHRTAFIAFLSIFAGLVSAWKFLPSGRKKKAVVKDLFVYPIKSCAGIRLEQSTFNRLGFRYDRQWMIVTPNFQNKESGKRHFAFMTAREMPKMVLVKPSFVHVSGVEYLVIESDGYSAVKVPVKYSESEVEACMVNVWNDNMHGVVYTEMRFVNGWQSTLGRKHICVQYCLLKVC